MDSADADKPKHDGLIAFARGAATVALGISALPMVLVAFGMLAITGQQCTPTSASHTLGDQLGIIAVAVGVYAVPVAPSVLCLRLGPRMLWKALVALALGVLAVLLAVALLGLLAIGTTC